MRDGSYLVAYNPDAPGKDWFNGRGKLPRGPLDAQPGVPRQPWGEAQPSPAARAFWPAMQGK